MNPQKATERADKAATRYASKQHRFRAETIAHTELAFAYNQGADMGVRYAIGEGLMGRCKMVWTTAGTNRVCSRCMALKDTVVGYTDESGVQLPPLHPRCRCAIDYREVEKPKPNKPLTSPQDNGNVGGGSSKDCRSFEELKTYWSKNYGITIAEEVRKLNFEAVREATEGIEAAIKLVPKAGEELTKIAVSNGGNGWLLAFENTERAFRFNRRCFLDENIIQTRAAVADTAAKGVTARNASILTNAAHEVGHAATLALARKLGMTERTVHDVAELFVKDVFEQMPAADKKRGLNKLKAEISQYAKKKGETLPEAFNDYFANGQGAVTLSKALLDRINDALTNDGFLERAVLSRDFDELKFGILRYSGLDNEVARRWYLWHDKRIHELIDESLSMEEKARKAFELRNKYRTQTRDLMRDRKLREKLDREKPNPTWEEILRHKIEDKGMTYEQAVRDIYETSVKTNATVNRALGLE